MNGRENSNLNIINDMLNLIRVKIQSLIINFYSSSDYIIRTVNKMFTLFRDIKYEI